jgi:type VI secretion system protein ImpF
MARSQAAGPVTLSVLDRLIDDEPKNQAEVPLTRAQSLRLLKAAVRRDLEWLLNTRRTIDPVPDSVRETARSVYHYGFADISSKSVLSSRDQSGLIREMESTIAVFETRLKRVRVRLEPVQSGVRALRFVIEGLLCMDPSPEPVVFDTLFELGKGEYEVRGDDGA